ncbi:NUDIX hydrolase [Deinococcus peraridilitoris]|uniref:ADP-ribose pyrophosphatase n=1 Tax=Deinococcus peraridilitoris (strain DSM 19664 / LMG 22246 / CIP 109416 / KR-200) TaxID=937777 RepID=K9ZZA5_DEIPD|nr:NUDIX domain-containing protein [Deinococcus peraridilitoris]AFZ66529.1 ADP-ribose pyrophosphatase [Deinococcus peraridilitoris DSM 19664]
MKTLTLPPQAAQVGLAVDVAAFAMHESELQVLLVQRGTLPHAQVWALPGGFVQLHEELHEAALRELREETSISLEPRHLEQFYTFGAPERDPRGRIVSVAHLAVLPHGTVQVTGGSGTLAAGWFPAHTPPPLAFDHAQILERALRRLQTRLEYAQLALEFLPETFTLPELQEVHEAILAKKLDKRNFRKRLLAQGLLILSGERRNGVGRPAQLYRRSKTARRTTV